MTRQTKATLLKVQVAESDCRFVFERGRWVGPCLFCGGRLALDPLTGEGATLEHIRPRTDGGTNDLANLGLAHSRCNHEKGRRTDPKKKRQADPERYERIVQMLLARRAAGLRPVSG
ncbi:MAG: HNH endonuclease [Chloroflexi bacterium]|nr:HNH endonuclease [Chloroflexota bacterium]